MKNIKIAIVEDDQVIAQMYRMKFESEGFEVQIAENGKLGVELAEQMKPDWGKQIPVIILTNLGEEEAPKSLQTLGVHSYIVKAELTPRQVTERVKQALGVN
jgi:DNA-binding response OmpR family regulator